MDMDPRRSLAGEIDTPLWCYYFGEAIIFRSSDSWEDICLLCSPF